MGITKWSLLMLLSIITGFFSICWSVLSIIFSSLDYEPDSDEDPATIWYNYRTGETDPVKRSDGIYQNHL